MNSNDSVTSNTLAHVDSQRRGFLAKMFAGGVALPMMSSIAFGEPLQTGKRKGGGKGKGGVAGKGQRRGGRADQDPAAIAKRMLQQFDKDGDQTLNEEELTAALKAMQERRSSMADGGAGKGKGGAGKGKGKGLGEAAKGQPAAGGGVTPKKPGQ